MNKQLIPLSILFSFILFSVFGFIVFNMKDGLPVITSIKNSGVSVPQIELPKKITTVSGGAPAVTPSKKDIAGFKRFTSDSEVKEYLTKSDSLQGGYGSGFTKSNNTAVAMPATMVGREVADGMGGGGVVAERTSNTNVQVIGIDEPDIVKTDGKNIYFSSQNYYYGGIREPMMRVMDSSSGIAAPYYKNEAKTKIVNAFPPSDLKEKGAIDKIGNLLLSDNDLVVFSGNFIYGYDVSDPAKPKQKWDIELKNGNQFVRARLYDGKIYLVTRKALNRYAPCPIVPFAVEKEEVSIPCGGIYHPDVIIPANVTYNVSTINVGNGKMDIGMSFLGSYDSTIYMSGNYLYAAYSYSGDIMNFFYGFVSENSDIFSRTVLDRIKTLQSYDIGQNTKMSELQMALNEFRNSMDQDTRLKFENEVQNRMSSYMNKHKRDLQKTDIVRVSLSDLNVSSIGTVPGTLLNQFSLDEYKTNLRVATTVGQGFFWFDFGSSQESENDVYVLDGDMSVVGLVQGLGLDERIYSARFIEDKGYLVTFKKTDPFFVMDLSDPKKPQISGELKIPGYSSYLHPIDKDTIVGIGKDASTVKISLFDVSDPKNPKEASKYMLNEYWSEVLSTHHAFLLDDKHKVFFMPGSKGGYVFSYDKNNVKLQKAVSGVSAKRALYLNDYLYIVGSDRIVVLDESNWERVNELVF